MEFTDSILFERTAMESPRGALKYLLSCFSNIMAEEKKSREKGKLLEVGRHAVVTHSLLTIKEESFSEEDLLSFFVEVPHEYAHFFPQFLSEVVAVSKEEKLMQAVFSKFLSSLSLKLRSIIITQSPSKYINALSRLARDDSFAEFVSLDYFLLDYK